MARRFLRCKQCRNRYKRKFFQLLHCNPETRKWASNGLCQYCQVGSPPKKKHPLNDYARRNAILRRMGYASYADYLASPLWASIRLRVLRRFQYVCHICGGRASQAHHNIYRKRILNGSLLKGMKALCGPCHQLIEFDEGKKLGVIQAADKFYEHKMPGSGPTGFRRKRLKRQQPSHKPSAAPLMRLRLPLQDHAP